LFPTFTLKTLANKKIPPPPFFYATFQCGRYNVFKFFVFFAHKKLKKPPSKVTHNQPHHVPAAQTSQELIFHAINISSYL
jgi:hypothetical protein